MALTKAQIRAGFPAEMPGDARWRWLAEVTGMPALLVTPPRSQGGAILPAPLLSLDIIRSFASLLGSDRVQQDPADRERHARGHSYLDLLHLRAGDLSAAPDAVLYPRGEEDVLAILAFAASRNIGIIPYGGGTNMVGGVTAAPGRVSIDMSGMARVLAQDRATITVEAGMRGAALAKLLAASGMRLDEEIPGTASLGGWIASRQSAASLCSARMATAHGVLELGAAGNLKAMMLGSEGSLGIFTQMTLRIRPLMPLLQRRYRLRDFASGVALLRETPTMLHLSDAAESAFAAKWAARPGLNRFFRRRIDVKSCRLTGSFNDEASARRMDAAVHQRGGVRETAMTSTDLDRDAMLDHGLGVESFEASVSWANLPALHAAVTQALETAMRQHTPRRGASGLVLGNVKSDGAVAFTCIFPRQLNDEITQARAIQRAGMDAILAQDGTIQAHGEDLLPWAQQGKGALGIAALRGVKRALDPENILNPGKFIPVEKPQA